MYYVGLPMFTQVKIFHLVGDTETIGVYDFGSPYLLNKINFK